MIPSVSKQDDIKCNGCSTTISANEDYYVCPHKNSNHHKNNQYSLCLKCWKNEKQSYTGSIVLGQRVKIKIDNDWKLGSIIKHWIDDDTYTIQIDGEKKKRSRNI
eukprot:275669_1